MKGDLYHGTAGTCNVPPMFSLDPSTEHEEFHCCANTISGAPRPAKTSHSVSALAQGWGRVIDAGSTFSQLWAGMSIRGSRDWVSRGMARGMVVVSGVGPIAESVASARGKSKVMCNLRAPQFVLIITGIASDYQTLIFFTGFCGTYMLTTRGSHCKSKTIANGHTIYQCYIIMSIFFQVTYKPDWVGYLFRWWNVK